MGFRKWFCECRCEEPKKSAPIPCPSALRDYSPTSRKPDEFERVPRGVDVDVHLSGGAKGKPERFENVQSVHIGEHGELVLQWWSERVTHFWEPPMYSVLLDEVLIKGFWREISINIEHRNRVFSAGKWVEYSTLPARDE